MLRNIARTLTDTKWNIGFLQFDGKTEMPKWETVSWLKHNRKDRWYADPFILSADGDLIKILAEEWFDSKKKGVISLLTVSQKGFKLEDSFPILELPTHLSFPYILRDKDNTYILPENCKSGTFSAYLLERNKLVKVAELLQEPLTDAVVDCKNFGGRNLIFSTTSADPNGKILNIYESDRPLGKYEKIGEVSFKDRCARNAGAFFKRNGHIVRPAQDCNNGYGKGLVFQQIVEDGKLFRFEEIKRVYPSNIKWKHGLHTFNFRNGLAVVDGLAYRTPYIGAFLNKTGITQVAVNIRKSLVK